MNRDRKEVNGFKNSHKEGNVVKTLSIGNTRIKICDDYCRDKTSDEVQAILDRIAYKSQLHLSAYSTAQKSAIDSIKCKSA